MTNINVNINEHKFTATVSNMVKFLSEIDAQEGKLEDSSLAPYIKNKIFIEEENGMQWWSPSQPKEVYKAIASC